MADLTLAAIARDTISYPLSTLRDNRPLVQAMQTALRRLGFLLGNADGNWRSDTTVAYTAFCQRFGLLADELSPRGASLLLKAIPADPVPPRPPTPSPRNLFEEALQFALKWEGGYVNHPADRGGETNRGITTATYRDYRARKGLSRQSVRFITEAEVREIYETMYWRPARCEGMGRALAIAHFDTAVNFGVGGATLFLQELLGVRVDRIFGPRTQAALAQANHGEMARRYPQLRINYRYRRVNREPSQRVFLQGWLNRDQDLQRYIQTL